MGGLESEEGNWQCSGPVVDKRMGLDVMAQRRRQRLDRRSQLELGMALGLAGFQLEWELALLECAAGQLEPKWRLMDLASQLARQATAMTDSRPIAGHSGSACCFPAVDGGALFGVRASVA